MRAEQARWHAEQEKWRRNGSRETVLIVVCMLLGTVASMIAGAVIWDLIRPEDWTQREISLPLLAVVFALAALVLR